MPIDSCGHTFSELTENVLPGHMARIREAMATPRPMAEFASKGVGPKAILKTLNKTKDFSGCYVLMERDRAIYVGISRAVVHRIMQHVKGKSHFDASLAYRIAAKKLPLKMTSAEAMAKPAFKQEFDNAKEYLKSLNVAFIQIDNDLELYLFEAYCAMELDTSDRNTFRTH